MVAKVLLCTILVAVLCMNRGHAVDFSICAGLDAENEVCNQLGLTPQCDSKIYCHGELLCTVQMARIFPDSKTFVDMKLKASEEETLANFAEWKSENPNPTAEDVKQFVAVSEKASFAPSLLDKNYQLDKVGTTSTKYLL